jgi:hypothetical protein
MKNMNNHLNLFELLGTLKDYRRKQGRRHSLQLVLLIAIMAVMAGAKSERAVARFAENNKADLIKALKITRGEVPSRYVIAGVLRHTDFQELADIFSAWALRFVPISRREWLSADGKAIGGTVKDAQTHRQNFISLVTVFAGKSKQALSAGKISTDKENEIPKVRELIRLLDLEGVVFSLDALHCQRETAAAITASGNDYCIGVKGNQPKLYEQVKKIAGSRNRGTYA